MGDVVNINPPAGSRKCPDCGGEWWRTDGVVIDDETGTVVAHAEPLECARCSSGGFELIVLRGTRRGGDPE